jgi:hypothetical protein
MRTSLFTVFGHFGDVYVVTVMSQLDEDLAPCPVIRKTVTPIESVLLPEISPTASRETLGLRRRGLEKGWLLPSILENRDREGYADLHTGRESVTALGASRSVKRPHDRPLLRNLLSGKRRHPGPPTSVLGIGPILCLRRAKGPHRRGPATNGLSHLRYSSGRDGHRARRRRLRPHRYARGSAKVPRRSPRPISGPSCPHRPSGCGGLAARR